MIDLETLGTKPDSVFLSIAAVQFDITNGDIGKTFQVNIELQSAIKSGRTIDADTIKWWLEQRADIMKKMFETPIQLPIALHQLSFFFEENKLIFPWGNSASFDLGMLNDAYAKARIRQPWSFRAERCYRTVIQMLNQFPLKDPVRAHDPIYDCEYQIQCLVLLNRELNFKLK